jgi:hypothetical protein
MDNFSHFLKTKSILSTLEAGALGWDSKVNDSQVAAGLLVHVYVYDLPTKWVWMCAIDRDAFISMSRRGSAQNYNSLTDVRNGIASLIDGGACGKPLADVDGFNWEHQLGGLLATYAGSTKTLAMANGLCDGGHFIVLNYRAALNTDGLLRPFIVPIVDNQILSVQQLNAAIDQVQVIDQQKHPEWFKK